jgi:hypothetical protein
MFDERDRKYFYDEFKNNGYEVGSYDDFKNDLNNKEDRDWYYNEAKNMGYDVGTQSDFDKMVMEPAASASSDSKQVAASATPQSAGQGASVEGKQQVAQPVAKPAAEKPKEDNRSWLTKWMTGTLPEEEEQETADKEPGLIAKALNMFPTGVQTSNGTYQPAPAIPQPTVKGAEMPVEVETTPSSANVASPESKEEVPASAAVVNNEGLMDAKLANYIENWKQRPDKEGDYFENMVADLLADGTANSNEEAVGMVKSALGRYANRSAMDVTNQVVSSLPDDTVQDAEKSIEAQWYSHGVQDKLKQEADNMGISYDDYVGLFLKPAMVQSLVNKYGPNYRDIAEGIATRLYSHDEHVQDRLMNQDINDAFSSVINKYVNPSVVDEYNKAQEAGSKAFTEGMEGSQFIPANLRLGTALGAQYEANEAKDPAKVLSGLQKKFGKLYRNPEFLNDMSNAAYKVMQRYGLNGTLGSDPKQFKPMINSVLKNELDQLEIKGMMPKGSAEYIMKTGLGNTIVGKITRKAVQTDYQNWLEDMANQQYQPGFWENVASGALTFAGDAWSYWLPGAAGGKLTKSMIAKAEGKLAGDLMAKGMERRVAERAAKVLIGKSKDVALKNGAVHGAVTFGGQSAISKPIDEKYRTGQFDENGKIYNPSVGKIIADTLGEVTKQSAVGAIMQGGTIANMIGKGRGLATNILADVGAKVVDSGIMTGQQMLERMAQDPNFKPTGKDAAESFLESMANLTAIGLPGMVGKYARFKDAREFNKKFDFTDQDIAELKRFGYEDLRDAFEKVGIGEYAVAGENAQRLDGQLTQKYMNLMNDKSVPEVLKAKMMAVVEGKRPSSFSPVVDSIIVQPMDHDGKVYLETLNKDGGIIERKEYSSLDEAQKADKKLEYEKTLGLASVLEGEFHNEFTQEHLDGLYNQAAQKYNMGEKLTDEDKAAVYLHQNAGAIKDIMDKQQKGVILTDEEQKQVNAYRHYYDSALENSSVMREFVNTFEDSHGVARGTLRKALESKDKKYAPLVESYLKELYNSIELKREMKQTMDDLYNTAHGNEQKRIEGENPVSPAEGSAGGLEPPVSEGPATYQDRTNSVSTPSDAEVAANPANVASSAAGGTGNDTKVASSENKVASSDAFVMGQEAYKNGDSGALQAIDYNSDLATGRLKRAFKDSDNMFDLVTKVYNEGRDMEQFLAQRASLLTSAQKEAISKYVEAMDAKKGAIDALQHADDGYGETLKQQLWPYQTEDGNIVPATLTSGRQVFLKKANEYGGGFVVVPDEQGQPTIKQVSDAEIKEVGTPVPLDEYIGSSLAQQKEARAQQFISQFDGSGLKPNDRVAVAMEEGDENIDMTFAGYSEDGNIVLTDGKDNIALTREEFDTWRTNALNNTINENLDREDGERELAEIKRAEAEKQERYKKGIFGYAAGQPDYSDAQTDPKVAAEYLQETAGDDRKALFANIVAEKQALQKRINQLREHIASNEEWLSINADLDPKNAETRTLANKQMDGQIADLQTRFDNWNKIRSAVMTPEEAQAIKADRTQKIADAGVNEGDVAPIEGREVAVLSDEELKKQYPTMDEASDFIASERKRIYRIQSDEVQREIDGVDEVLDRFVNGEIDLEPEQIKELNTTKAQLQARQANLTESAKELKAQADKLNTLYRKENMEARAKVVENLTPAEQRAIKVENAIKNGNMSQLNAIYDEVRGAIDFNDTEPNTLEEYVANSIGRFTLNYEGKEKGGAFSNGIQQETGLGRKDFDKLQILAKEGEGKTVPEFVHDLYDDMPKNLKQMGYTDQDIRSAFLDLIGSAQSYSDIKNYALNNKVANVEQQMREVERQEEEMMQDGAHSEAFDKIVDLAKEQKEYWDLMEQGEVDPDDVPEVDVAHDMDELLKTLSDEEFKEVSDVLKGIDEEFEYFTANEYERREGANERKEKAENANTYDESIKEALKPVSPFAIALKSAVESGDKKAIKQAQKELTDALIASDLGHGYLAGQLAAGKMVKKKDELYKVKRATVKPITDAMNAIESALDSALKDAGLDGVHVDFDQNGDGWIYADKDSPWNSRLEALDNNFRNISQRNGKNPVSVLPQITLDNVAKVAGIIKSQIEEGEKYNSDENSDVDIKNAPFADRLKNAIAETETEPTEAQKKAGNYKKGHLTFGGYDFTVETPKGVTRSGKDEQGNPWSVTMHDTYGYILGKIGVDGDHIDMFINDSADLDTFDGNVCVVDQVNPETGEFDEHKVMYGYPDEAAATKAYLSNYSKGWKGLGKVTSVPKATFDKWLESSDRKTKPFAEYAMVQKEQAKFDRDVKEVKPSEMTEAQKVAYDAVSTMLKKAGIPVKVVSNEDMEKVAEAQDNMAVEMLLNDPRLRFYIKTPEQKEAAKAAYDWAAGNRPDKFKQYAIVNMDNPNQPPQYFEKKDLAEKWRKYYTNAWKIGNYKAFNLNKPFEEQIKDVKGDVPSEFDPYKAESLLNKRIELEKQIKETEDSYNAKKKERAEYQNQLMQDYMDQHGLSSENDIPDDVWTDYRDKSFEKYQDTLDDLFHKYVELDNQLKAVAEPGVQYLKGKGVVYGYTDGKQIVLNQEHLNPNTPIHEYQHLWRTAAKEMNPELIEHGDKLIMKTQLFADLKQDPNYNHLTDEQICDEAFARLTGEDGAAILEQMAKNAIKENPLDTAKELSVINKLKEWLKKFWYWTLDTFTKWKPEDIKKMTLEDIRNLVLRDLANGVDPRTKLHEAENADDIKFMGSTTKKRMKDISTQLEGRELDEAQQAVADVYSGKKDNVSLTVEREDGSNKIIMRQGNDNHAGTKHSVFRHYGVKANSLNVNDLLLIPTVLKEGERKVSDNGRVAYVYVDPTSQVKYTVVTEPKNNKEFFNDFYSNKKANPSETSRVVENSTNTPEGAHNNDGNAFMDAKVDNNSETAKGNGGNLSVEDKIKAVSQQFGVDEADVAMYANAVKKGSTAEAARARANIKRYLLQANEDKISSFKELLKYTVPVNEALKENFGDLDAMIEERVKQVEAQRNAMEAARKRAEEEEAKRQKHLEELSLIPDDQLDKQYMDALAKGDDATAREMLDEAARRKGYDDTESSYQGVGAWAAPGNPGYESDKARRDDWESSGSDVNLEDMAMGYTPQPDDYFSHPERYSQNTPHGLESVKAINTAIDAIKNGEKDVKVKVYRAVPTSVKEGKLRNGDWVTPSKKYAEMHGTNRLEGKYRIIEDEVPANQLWWDGNDANEFGFDDGKAYKYKNAKNNRKLNDLVTYDDNGDVIPPSKRFNSRKQDVRFHRVTEPEELERLNKEKTFRMYSGMQEVDGKLYSPMAAIIDGKRTDATEIGAWMGADERPDLVKGGKFQLVKTDKNPGAGEGPVRAAYNPYMHTSSSMMNDQFTGAYARGNIKVVEWEIPESEKTSGYRAEGAKDAVGLVPWHSGSVNGLLPKDRQRSVMLSRWRKAVRVVPDAEVAESIAEQLEGTGLAIPWNVVTPNQVRELVKLGVPITTVESGQQAPETKEKFMAQMEELRKEFPQAQFVNVKMTKDAFKEWGKKAHVKARLVESFEKEKARIASDAKEKGSYMLAPNGKKSKLDAEQWATVRTTNFKKWFGDWENDPENASKVVDENGEPMVVYHGRSADFNTFEKKEGVRFIMGLEDKVKAEGFFFSPDRALAEEFAGNAARHRGGKANVVPCYLNIRKPMDLTGEDYDRIYEDVTGWDYTVGMDTQDNLWGIMDEEGMADKIKAKGYDGAIFVEEVDDNYEPTKISYCALDANQIKSADKNNGEFSSRNNDIRFRFGEPYDYEKYPLGRVEPNLANKDVKIVHADANHGFKNFKEARNWAKKNIVKIYTEEETGGKGLVRISNTALDKYLSQKAVDKSDSQDVHLAVLKVLPSVLKESIDAETHPDFIKGADGERRTDNGINKDLLVHRCYGAVNIDGKIYRVKITLKEEARNKDLPHKAYSYEATKIELLAGTLVKPEGDNPNTNSSQMEPLEAIDAQVQDHGSHSNDSISGTNLLKKVEMSYDKGKKLLDESEKMGISIENQRKIADSVVNTANKLGGAEATVYSSLDDVPEEYRSEVEQGAKGWYDPETHTVHVYLPNCEDGNDAQRTVFHEKIGHEGMEVLLGGEDEVRKFANFVYNSVAASTRGKILEIANEYDPGWKKHDRMNVGTQEYIARLAEEGPKTADDFSLWTKIKHYLIKVLKKLGIRVPGLLNDKDLRYYLMKAGKALHVWDDMPEAQQEAMMKQASNAEIKDSLGEGAGKGKPRQKKGESMIQYMKRVQEWRKWKDAREDENDPEPPMFYDIDKDEAGKKEWELLNKEWRDRHHLAGEEPTGMPIRMKGETDDAYMTRIHDYEKWKDAMKDEEDPIPDMFDFEKSKQEEVKRKYEDWLARHELLEQQQADLDLYEGKIYPAETNPKADDLEQQVMQDLAEVTSTDVSKEGAAKTVKHAVIHRRKNMEEASADDAIYINDVKNRIEKMADSGVFDKLLSDYKGKANRAEKLAEAIPYIIEAPRRLRDMAHDLNATGAFDKGHIHIQPEDVEAIQPYVADLIAETAKQHSELKDDKEVVVYDDPLAVGEVASKMAQAINNNHQGEEGFVPIDGSDIMSEHVLPLVMQQIVPDGIDYKNLSPEMKAALDSIRDWYNYTYDWLKDNRTLKEDTGYNADYVNHIWDKEKSDKQAYAMYVENRQRTKSPNEKPRTISTLMEGISVGLVPKTTDITKMMAYYSRSNIEAWVNKTMLQELSGLNVIERNEDGEVVSTDPLLSSTPPFNLEQYKYFEIPGMGPVWVYNVSPKQVTVKNPITGKDKVLYSEASAGDRFGVVFETYQSSPFWKAFDTLASSAKKLELGFSGFHAGALTEVYMVQNMVEFGPKMAMANFMKYIFVDTMKNHELPCFANPQDFQEAASHLVKFGATNDYAAADVQNMFDNLRDAMMKVQEKLKDGNGISGTVAVATMPLKVVTQLLSLVNKGMDRALWDFLHDGLKLATYRMRADKTKERAKKKGWTEEELSRALDEDGQFVNDMFGGQHWDVLGASHRTLRYAGRVLLSPDWNASTTRHFLALTGYGSIWNEATFENFKQYYQRLWNKELTPEDEGRRGRQISALLCYGIGFMVFYEAFANGVNAAFRAMDESQERKKAEEMRKTNPDYKSMYELAYGDEGMKWYDYLMRGNSLGQQSKIFLGRYADGTEMYIRHGKQFREVPEYLFNHKGELEFPGPMVQRMIGKANPMVRMTLDDINYLSDFQASHADQEIQRKYGKSIGLLYKDALYWAPFLIPSQENKEFKAVDFFFPSSKGFSPWKAQSYFKDFILSGDMEGVVMTYQSCKRNGIDAEAQIKAAIGSVKALESAEMKDGVTSLQVACLRFDAAKSITEKKKMRQKMKKFLSMSDYKAFTQKEALDMVQGYLNGEEDLKEMEKADSKYLMAAKAEDVTEDWRIQNAWNGTMEAYEEYQRLKDIDKAKANAFKNSKTNKRLFAARKAISAAKRKMNKAKKQMDGTNGAAKMVEIRKTRKELLEKLNGME